MFWITNRNLNLLDEYSRVQQNLLEHEHEYVALGRSDRAGDDRRGGCAVSERHQCQSRARAGPSVVGDARLVAGERCGVVADHHCDALAVAVTYVHQQGAALDVGRWRVWGVLYFVGIGAAAQAGCRGVHGIGAGGASGGVVVAGSLWLVWIDGTAGHLAQVDWGGAVDGRGGVDSI